MKKYITMFALGLFVAFLVACTGTETPASSTDVLLSVEINPSFQFVIGQDDKVKSYRLNNEDAEIVGAGLDLVGMHYEDALKAMLNQAIDSGYIDVERSDQAVALMAANGDADEENQFRETVQTKLQTFFQDNAIGAVVLNHGILDPEVIAFSETHEVTIGFAKLALAYLVDHPEVTVDDVLLLTPSELVTGIGEENQAFMATYRNQRQTNALEVKDELKAMIQEKVQAHKDAVTAGTKSQPDLTGVEASYMNNYAGMKEDYQERNAARKTQAKAKLALEVPRMVSVDINPAIEMIIDVQGYVFSVMYKNEDAEIVGAGLDLIGKTYQEALQLYMNAAVETGYIDVERNDNGVALMASSLDDELDETFRLQIQTMLQTYFQENALGAVVINKGEVNEEVEALVETYDISYGFAKLVLSYLEAYPEELIEDVLLLEPADLIEDLASFQISYHAQYKSEKEADALLIKNEMKLAVQAKVQIHKDAVAAGTKTQPDMTGVMEQYLNNYQTKVQEFVQANEARKNAAKGSSTQGTGSLLSVNINPEMEMIIDVNGYVISAKYKNEDAEIVGAGLTLIGLHYEDALKLYLNAAIQTGYLDIERNDNAVVVQTANMNEGVESALQLQVQTKLQTFFQENAVGAVVLTCGEIDPEVQALVDTYDITVGHAKLIISYMELYPDLTIDDVLLIPIQQLVLYMVEEHNTYMQQFKNQRELDAQAVKDEMVDALKSKVQAHFQQVDNGTKTQPDITGIKEQYLANYEEMHQGFVLRNQERKEAAKQQVQQNSQQPE
ncbi:MAG: hypothetical protein RBQ71_02845 [Acholeplasmataceae bacterium]|jgi:hypothetical protein|nr:hypothetical protein [Acholeplasmataceae bacterium]